MPTIHIDDLELQVEPGASVIQAAEALGISIPRYCYHPGMSIAGSCRMCMVEVEKMPKLAIACYTPVSDGMRVSTTSERVLKGRRDMLEFLLHNHPLDCPVCDQSGECDLQNFYMEHGGYQSRFVENKVKKRKAFPIGPHVVLDQERCILCSRCTRFCSEVSKSHELGIFNRGSRSVVDLNPGKTLDNPYSGNVIDICPVGALTEREFRFQCRVWYLSQQESVCPGCSRGCNISLHFNKARRYKAAGKRLQRIKPRFNPEVNTWWMCDEGRFGYDFVDQNRIENPLLRRNRTLGDADWKEALEEAARRLRDALERDPQRVGVIASPKLSNEELYLIREFFQETLKIPAIASRDPWEREGFSDGYLVRADKNPNSKGAADLGMDGDARSILKRAAAGEIDVLYVFQHSFQEDGEALQLLQGASCVIYQGSNHNAVSQRSHIVLPSAVYAEKEGTFTNFEGRVQRFLPAFEPLGEARTDLAILLDLAKGLGHDWGPQGCGEIYGEWSGKSYESLAEYGEKA